MNPPPDPAGGYRRQLHVFFLLDCSSSMQGESIRGLNDGMRAAIPAMREAAEHHVAVDVLVRAIRFADEATWHVAAPTPVHRLAWHDVAAGGHTAMGGALRLLADQLAPRAMPGPQLRPIVILISDGRPTDDLAAGLRTLEAAPYGPKTIRTALALGPDADAAALAQFAGSAALAPLRLASTSEVADRLRWASATAIGAASRPAARSRPAA